MINFDEFWAPAKWPPGIRKKIRSGVLREDIETWERKRGVRLPDVLRSALAKQNGGYLFESQIEILPLQRICKPGELFWSQLNYKRSEVPKTRLLLRFGDDYSEDCAYYLNYNGARARAEPSVFVRVCDTDCRLFGIRSRSPAFSKKSSRAATRRSLTGRKQTISMKYSPRKHSKSRTWKVAS